MNAHTQISKKQQGVMLLEALISILIFSIGILALVGLQAASISISTDAKYRSDASMLANQMIGQMWNDAASAVANSAPGATFSLNEFDSYRTNGANFTPWEAALQNSLPNASAAVATNTVITPAVTGAIQTTSTSVNITVTWQPPGAATPHSYTTSTQIAAQKQIN